MKFSILFLILMIQPVFSQIELKVDCSKITEEACFIKKIEESKVVNEANLKIFMSALKVCRPLKFNTYHSGKIISTTEVFGMIEQKCKYIQTQMERPVRTTCLLDKVGMTTLSQDIRGPEVGGIFREQCKNEIFGDTPEAQKMKNSQAEGTKDFVAFQNEMLPKIKKEFSDLKLACQNKVEGACNEIPGRIIALKKSCKELELTKECDEFLKP